jgi:hypothetical protein
VHLSLHLSEHGYHRQAETITRPLLLGENLPRLSTPMLGAAVVSGDVFRKLLVDCKSTLRIITIYRVKLACPSSEWSGNLRTLPDLPLLWSLDLKNLSLQGTRRAELCVNFGSIKRFDEANGHSGNHEVSTRGSDVFIAGLRASC